MRLKSLCITTIVENHCLESFSEIVIINIRVIRCDLSYRSLLTGLNLQETDAYKYCVYKLFLLDIFGFSETVVYLTLNYYTDIINIKHSNIL